MITVKSYFEKNHVRAQVVGFNSITPDTERVVYSIPIQLYSGVNNPVKITCLNSDQKPVNVTNVSIQMGLFEPNTQNEVILANAAPIDAANGVVQVTFTPSQLAPLDFGMYEIALTATDANLNAYPVYINDNYGSRLTTTLSKGPVFAFADPIPVVFTDVTDVGVVSNQIDLTMRPMNSTTATLCANIVSYTGNIVAQGTMVTTPLPNDWGNVSSTYYSNAAGLVFQTVSGSYALIRFVLDSIDPNRWGNVSPSNIALYVNGGNIRI